LAAVNAQELQGTTTTADQLTLSSFHFSYAVGASEHFAMHMYPQKEAKSDSNPIEVTTEERVSCLVVAVRKQKHQSVVVELLSLPANHHPLMPRWGSG